MIISCKAVAAAAAAFLLTGAAGAAQAQPSYGKGDLPPPPYIYVGDVYGGCRSHDEFTLLGAHAGVTVLGLDLGASAHFGVPVESGCEGGSAPVFVPRPYAPPPVPMAYGPPPYAYQSYAPPPPPQPPMGYAYGDPCGCVMPPRW